MTRIEAAKILADTVCDITVATDKMWFDLSTSKRKQMLERELKKRRFPFGNRTLLKQLIPTVESWMGSILEINLKIGSDSRGKLLTRSTELFDIAIQAMKEMVA